ncbi:helix-turn-helix domain-containing protein [Sediminibacillus terrae]|uniref:helix-turn-helix domain-containing protein n=1 Tax=Sediminibacillus terrae TaxID=1562106 RepID=UPI001294E292|nr:helix-turn-helix domain-containing protein [Sediminibacillus terrae]
MKWADYKKNIHALDSVELEQIQLIAQLVARRKQLGITQKDLARMTGLKQSAIARIEKEGSVPRLDTIEKISNALGLKLTLMEQDENAATLDRSLTSVN